MNRGSRHSAALVHVCVGTTDTRPFKVEGGVLIFGRDHRNQGGGGRIYLFLNMIQSKSVLNKEFE